MYLTKEKVKRELIPAAFTLWLAGICIGYAICAYFYGV